MNIKSKLRIAVTSLLTAVISCAVLCACDNAIYDGEGDCNIRYTVKFRDNYNIKNADAFASEVTTVTLYLIDEVGDVVWKKTDSGSALTDENYVMDVDVAPGQYSLLAWAGTMDKSSYTFANSSFGKELTCTLNRQYDTNRNALVYSDLDGLFHGYLADEEFPDKPGSYTYNVPLVKNTNSVKVVLQEMSGEAIDSNKFTFAITDSNGKMDWDNSLLPDENITYYAWNVGAGELDLDWSYNGSSDSSSSDTDSDVQTDTENETDANSATDVDAGTDTESGENNAAGTDAAANTDTNADAAAGDTGTDVDAGTASDTPADLNAATRAVLPSVYAQLTTCRMVKGQSTRLTVTNNETGEIVFSVPLVDYALMVKDFYNADMDDQEFLDRQDSYEMVFFLDEGYRWMRTFIYINSWRIVLQDSDL